MKVATLVSGSGTNLQALIDARDAGQLGPTELCCVISNRPLAPALGRAEAAAIPAEVIDHRAFARRSEFEAALRETLERYRAEALVLAGFMRILSAELVAHYPLRIINTHPALCPAFPGIDAPRQALEHGVKITGCTVHFVDAGVDTGPIIFQAAVDIESDDDPDSLHQRIRAHEHKLLPKAVRLLAEGRISVAGRRVTIRDN